VCVGRYACCFCTLSSSSRACDIDIVVLFGALFVHVFYCAREAVLSMAMLAVVSQLLVHGSAAASDADANALALRQGAAAACVDDATLTFVEARYGRDKTLLEYVDDIDGEFLISRSFHLPLLTKSGAWAVTRNVHNCGRGEKGSVLQRKASVEETGLIWDNRGGAWVIQHDDELVEDEVTSIHCATLIEGAKAAWEADKDKKIRCVQISVARGIPNCKKYRRGLNQFAALIRYLKLVGNKTNDKSTVATIIEGWQATPDAQKMFKVESDRWHWTHASLGIAAYNDKKLAVANTVYTNWWATYTSFEVCGHFFKEASKHTIDKASSQYKGQTFYDALCSRVREEVVVH
jgi:hypothetical protein